MNVSRTLVPFTSGFMIQFHFQWDVEQLLARRQCTRAATRPELERLRVHLCEIPVGMDTMERVVGEFRGRQLILGKMNFLIYRIPKEV